MMRVLVGGCFQESNTFTPVVSTIKNFSNFYFLIGNEMEELKGVKNEVYGFYQAALEEGVELIPTMFALATSGGKVSRQCVQELKGTLLQQMAAHSDYDGILLMLHGAMVAEDCDDVEGELLADIRAAVGPDIPISVSVDSHAHITPTMLQHLTGLVGYKTYPHQDYVQTGYQAAKLLFSSIKTGKRPYFTLAKVPMVVPAENMQTMYGPMHQLIQEAKNGEANEAILVSSLFPVQPWLDVEGLGFSVVVISHDPEEGEKEAKRLAQMAWELRADFSVKLYDLSQVLEKLREEKKREPIIISDASDSPSAGSTGDSNYVLNKLLEYKAEEQISTLLTMVDAPAVEQAIRAGVGQTVRLSLGYTLNKEHGKPIQVKATVRKIGDGKFTLGTGFAEHSAANMGRCAVIEIGKIHVLLSEIGTFVFDPSIYRYMGLEPKDYQLIMVKSAVQFKSGFKDISQQHFILDTPGHSSSNLLKLPFSKVSRPLYPFDPMFDWAPSIIFKS